MSEPAEGRTVTLRVVFDEGVLREWHEEYLADWRWERAHEPHKVSPDAPDALEPQPYEEWLADVRANVLKELTEPGVSYRVEVVPDEPTALAAEERAARADRALDIARGWIEVVVRAAKINAVPQQSALVEGGTKTLAEVDAVVQAALEEAARA